jgi:hypothetical protein
VKKFFDKILDDKCKKDIDNRKMHIEPSSLDELTATKFLMNYPTVNEASAALL